MSKYSIVIPIKRYTYFWSQKGYIDKRKNTLQHDNIKRFFEISWITHDKNFIKEDIDCIFFIVSFDEKKYFESFVNKYIKDINIKIIIEDELISSKYNFKSHRKQMLLKLLIYKYIKTDLYLILDDDIISTKEFGYNNLFNRKKIKYSYEGSIEGQPYVWMCSRDLLKLKKKTNIYKLRNVMSVTPEIMITSVVRDMIDYLISIYGNYDNLYNEMIKLSWTEYTLYWLYLKYIDKVRIKNYIKDSFTSTNLMVYDKNYIEIIRKTIKDKKNYFMIIQSNVYEYKINNLKNALQI